MSVEREDSTNGKLCRVGGNTYSSASVSVSTREKRSLMGCRRRKQSSITLCSILDAQTLHAARITVRDMTT